MCAPSSSLKTVVFVHTLKVFTCRMTVKLKSNLHFSNIVIKATDNKSSNQKIYPKKSVILEVHGETEGIMQTR